MHNDPVGDLVLGGIDQFLPQRQLQKDIFQRVDDIVVQAVEDGNPDRAGDAMEALIGVSQVSGIALAKFIYVMKFQWEKFNRKETFEDWALRKIGREPITLKRNFTVWEMLVSGDIPREYVKKFEIMPIGCLIPISTMWKQEWDIDSSQWHELANAPDRSTIGAIIRKIKGKEPKKGSLQISYDSDAKEITMWKNSEPHIVYLQYDEEDKVILAGLERLLGGGKTLEK